MKCVSAISTVRDSRSALREVVDRATRTLEGESADLALVFASMHHVESLGEIAAEITRSGLGQNVLGCTGESIVGEDQEIEGTPALSLWSLRLPGITVRPRRLTFAEGAFDGWPDSRPSLRPELTQPPHRRMVHRRCSCWPIRSRSRPTCSSSGSARPCRERPSWVGWPVGATCPMRTGSFLTGLSSPQVPWRSRLSGPLKVRSIVSQGCRPIGPTMIVTKIDRNVIRELGRRPALEVVRDVFANLPEEDQELVQQGLHIGRVINEYQEKFQRGDFLVRNVIGSDDAGGIAITDVVRVGQTVQFHVRDARTADEDLRGLLINERQASAGARLGGALLFTCNGRGSRLFPQPHHDVSIIHEVLGLVPVAGFFAMGEIGPVGGQNFVHGFTASIALFEEA